MGRPSLLLTLVAVALASEPAAAAGGGSCAITLQIAQGPGWTSGLPVATKGFIANGTSSYLASICCGACRYYNVKVPGGCTHWELWMLPSWNVFDFNCLLKRYTRAPKQVGVIQGNSPPIALGTAPGSSYNRHAAPLELCYLAYGRGVFQRCHPRLRST